ncbi:hypothetical protein [Methylobacterium sp. GXF4]|uniref:hypothetical protein n=1 Tax=Methylobacterium sp. GXF4 TaxID=1096546 RepID=UPI00329A2D9A
MPSAIDAVLKVLAVSGKDPRDDDCDYEHSSLSGSFTRDGETVDVEIYRFAGTQDPWRLAVVHMSGGNTEWQERFATEEDAYAAFLEVAEKSGLASFCARPSESVH